jgi:Villin headpiece domain
LEGSDCEINIQPSISEADLGIRIGTTVGSPPPPPPPPRPPPTSHVPIQKSSAMLKAAHSPPLPPSPPLDTIRHQKTHCHHPTASAVVTSHSNGKSIPVVQIAPGLGEKNDSNIKTTMMTNGHVSSSKCMSSNVAIPYQQLKNNTTNLPAGVDPAYRERSLSRSEFETIFGMSPTDFDRLPAWKRTALKKQHGLF